MPRDDQRFEQIAREAGPAISRPLLGFASLAGAYVIMAGVYVYAGFRRKRALSRRAALEAELKVLAGS